MILYNQTYKNFSKNKLKYDFFTVFDSITPKYLIVTSKNFSKMTNCTNSDQSKITITDIARDSGVSPATVSLVLRDKPGIGSETRQRVLETALSLGYISSIPAPQPQPKVTSLGLLMKAGPNDPPLANHFYTPVLAGIEAYCRRHQIHLFYAHIPVDDNNHILEAPRLLLDQPADGLLLVGAWLNEGIRQAWQPQSKPLVLVDAYADVDLFDSVITDNTAGAYQATRYLIEQGHRAIGIVGSLPQAYPSIQERREGYVQAMADYDLPPHFINSHLSVNEAVPATLAYLKQHSEVSAVFCCNDEIAIDLMVALNSEGRRVPEDISIVGFDNIALCEYVIPALTTIRVDKMGMGRQAAQLLVNRIENPDTGYMKTIIRPSLIERQSVKRKA